MESYELASYPPLPVAFNAAQNRPSLLLHRQRDRNPRLALALLGSRRRRLSQACSPRLQGIHVKLSQLEVKMLAGPASIPRRFPWALLLLPDQSL